MERELFTPQDAEPFGDEPMATAELTERPLTPMGLILAAVEHGTDPHQLEVLLNLHERNKKTLAEEAYAAAMHACQQEMPVVIRDAENSHTRSRYALLETVQATCRPTYTKHGFSLSFGEAEGAPAGYKRTVVDVRHSAGHCQRYQLDLPIDGTGAQGGRSSMNAVQGCISTTSYGQRRLICMVFNITVANEDSDGNSPGNGMGSEWVSEGEVRALSQLIKDSKSNLDKFCEAYQISSLEELPKSQLAQARSQLLRKMQNANR